MKQILIPAALLLTKGIFAQCPNAVNLTTTGNCPGATLTVQTPAMVSKIIWYKGSITVSTVTASPQVVTVAGGNGQGSAANQLNFSTGVAVDGNGNVYVGDWFNNRVQKWAPGAISGITIAGGNGSGPAANQLSTPGGVRVDGSGNVYVADRGNNRVQKWAPGASAGVTVAGGNGQGSAANQLDGPNGIYVDGSGNIYVADVSNSRIQKWAPGATTGITVAGGNGYGPAANQLEQPPGVFVDGSGDIYIADQGNNRVQKWAPGATAGVTVAGGNGSGAAANQLSGPTDVAVDNNGNIYVNDRLNSRVQEWMPGATSAITVAGGSEQGSDATHLILPYDIYVDNAGNIYVSDQANSRVQEWSNPAPIDRTFTATIAGAYTAVVTDNTGCTLQTTAIIINPLLAPAVNISPSSVTASQCMPVIFTALPINGGDNPTYQWAVNGTVTGNNTAVYTDNSPANGDIISCTMTTDAACPTVITAAAVPLTLVVSNTSPFSISGTGSGCTGIPLKTNTSTGISTLVWYKDGSSAEKTATSTGLASSSGVTVAGGLIAGTSASQLNDPDAIFIDGSGNLYIADNVNQRVQKWAPGATTGVTVAGGNGVGAAANQFNGIFDVFVDVSGNIYAGDRYNVRVQKWTPGATTGITVAGGNGQGTGANQFFEPTAIYVDGSGNVYVNDDLNYRVQKWAPGATSGTTVAGGNGSGSAANQLYNAFGLDLDASGNIYIADAGNNRIQKWAPGATSGITVAGGNGYGPATNQLADPLGIFVDGAGDIYIADDNNSRIQKWAQGATTGVTVAGGNGQGSSVNQLYFPDDVSIDNKGNVYIADSYNNRIQEWGQAIPADTAYTPTEAGTYTATITTPGGCTFTTNAIVVAAALVPAINVGASTTTICSGTPITFTATPTNGGASPVYQWQINGVNTGAGGAVYTDGTLANGASVSCTMTSDVACPSPPIVTSDPIRVVVNPVITPSATITASPTTVCSGQPVVFTAVLTGGGPDPSCTWQVNGSSVSASGQSFTSNSLQDGDKVDLLLIGDAACSTALTASSNVIPVSVTPVPGVTITTAASTICSGTPVAFTAMPVNVGNTPVYQWQVNGVNAGTGSPYYTDDNIRNGDIVTCLLKSGDVCPTALSNSISVTINSTPAVDPNQVFSITPGQGVTLTPSVSGNISGYSWSPATGLSDPDIPNPVATPSVTTQYTLQVISPEGCVASGPVIVYVVAPISIPSAFSPNGDGKNDVFYVLGGPVGLVIREFTVFNRWGQLVFQAHDAPAGNPSFGWNGQDHGSAVPADAYVYIIAVRLPSGTEQVFKGTVLVIR